MQTPIGRLRHRVTFQKLTTTRGLSGGEKNEWVGVCTVWARVSPLSGKALFAAQQNHSEVTGTIDMRYRADINAKMRAMYEGKTYHIHAVIDPDLRHKELRLMVSEGLVKD
jgi:SPP1 family predicted phage head-tail adaptor